MNRVQEQQLVDYEKIKCPVREIMCGIDRHHQKTETCRARPFHKDKVCKSKGAVQTADSCRGITIRAGNFFPNFSIMVSSMVRNSGCFARVSRITLTALEAVVSLQWE